MDPNRFKAFQITGKYVNSILTRASPVALLCLEEITLCMIFTTYFNEYE